MQKKKRVTLRKRENVNGVQVFAYGVECDDYEEALAKAEKMFKEDFNTYLEELREQEYEDSYEEVDEDGFVLDYEDEEPEIWEEDEWIEEEDDDDNTTCTGDCENCPYNR